MVCGSRSLHQASCWKRCARCVGLLILRACMHPLLSAAYIKASISLSHITTAYPSPSQFLSYTLLNIGKMIFKNILALFSFSTPILAVSSPLIYSNTTNSSFQTPNFTFSELYNLTDRFLQNHMYPLNIAQSLSINSSLLSDDILGRVDATRDYAGRELNTEYLFGLFANIALNPNAFTLLGYPLYYTFTRFLGSGNVVSFAAVVEYMLPVTKTTIPQELDFWLTFNEKGEISQYDG